MLVDVKNQRITVYLEVYKLDVRKKSTLHFRLQCNSTEEKELIKEGE